MAKVDIWMPVYIGDYLRDTQDLDATEHGVYFLLMMHYWQQKGQIGTDVGRLSRVAKSNLETTQYILSRYFTLTDEGYKNKRSDEEIAAAESRRAAAAENGKKGGRPPKKNPQKTHRLPTGKPTENPKGNPQKTSSSSSSSSSSKPPPPKPATLPPPLEVRAEKTIKHWNSLPNLPPFLHDVCTLIDTEKAEERFAAYPDAAILQAISNLNKYWEKLEPRYRSSSLKNFLTWSLDSWVPAAHPERRFKSSFDYPEYVLQESKEAVPFDEGLEQLEKVKSELSKKGA